MEHLNNEIDLIVITDDKIMKITYDNKACEEINICDKFFVDMRTKWLISQPPFISDRYKNIMNDITLACIHKNLKSINELNNFFTHGNENVFKDFLSYMRKRDLTEEKKKWKIRK